MFGAEGWKESLLSALPAGILPAQWGGTKIVDHEQQICLGGEVSQTDQRQYQPQEITGEEDREDDDDDPGVTDMGDVCTIKIGPGSLITQKYTINKDCNLRWKFKSKGGDLGFGVQRKIAEKTSDGVSVEMAPSGDIKDVLTITRVIKIFIINYFLIAITTLNSGLKPHRCPGWCLSMPGWLYLRAHL